MQEFNISGLPIIEKYSNKAVKYYIRRLSSLIDGKDFKELPPAKDWSERINRVTSKVYKASNTVEKSLIDLGEKLDTTIDEKGWTDKFKGFFKKKFTKDPVQKENSQINYQEVNGSEHQE